MGLQEWGCGGIRNGPLIISLNGRTSFGWSWLLKRYGDGASVVDVRDDVSLP